ncbi:MAG: CRTAC1 family protein [Pirellulaceae bacterium]
MRSFSDCSNIPRPSPRPEPSAWVLPAMLLVVTAAQTLAGEALAGEETTIRLHDVTPASGIQFRHTDGSSGEYYLVEAMASGLATFDYDRDGDLDIYFLNGAPLRGTVAKETPRNALYRNDGGLRFTEVTQESGLGDPGYGLGVAIGDYDGDGYQDVYLNNFGPNALYRNAGDGTFTDVTAAAGLKGSNTVGAGASFLDMEGDGDLDLYVANYIKFSYDTFKPSVFRDRKVYGGPMVFPAEADQLFRNDGDGTFTDVSRQAGISGHASWGMGTAAADFDDDGDTDIFVANDSDNNFLFQNDGRGKFKEVGLLMGVAYDYKGETLGSMGVDVGDFNNDGKLDIFHTSYQKQLTALYQNMGGGFFQDVTLRTGAGAGTFQRVNWGTGLVDFDNDGDRDIFFANGHIHDNLDEFDDTTSYLQPNQLLENKNGRRFVDVSQASGVGLRAEHSGRGACFEDFDNDGDIDAVVLNSRGLPTLLENRTQNAHGWIEIDLVGGKTNRDGVGARVWVHTKDRVQVAEVHSGRGYQSHFGSRLHFGLAEHQHVDRIEVRWIGGGRDVIRDIPAGQIITIHEGGRLVSKQP